MSLLFSFLFSFMCRRHPAGLRCEHKKTSAPKFGAEVFKLLDSATYRHTLTSGSFPANSRPSSKLLNLFLISIRNIDPALGSCQPSIKLNPNTGIRAFGREESTPKWTSPYPKPFLRKLIDADTRRELELHKLLNGIGRNSLIRGGRTYGGGLHKLEPKELAALPIAELPSWIHIQKKAQETLPLEF
jgi:hypothetical protein